MAGMNQISFTSPYTAEEADIERRQRLAEMLGKQAMTPLGGTEMAGPIAIRRSPLEGAAKMMQGYVSGKTEDSSLARRKELVRQMQADAGNWYGQQPQGTPAQIQDTSQQGTGSMDMSGSQGPANVPAQPVNPQQNMQWLQQGMQNPMTAPIAQMKLAQMVKQDEPITVGKTLMTRKGEVIATDPSVRAEAEAKSKERMQELEMKLKDASIGREERAALSRELAGMHASLARELAADRAAQGSKPPPGYRMKPDGSMEAIPGGPADTKLQGVLNQDTQTLNGTTAALDRLAASANEVMQHPGLAGSFGIRGAIPNIPGTAAADATAKLQALQAQVGFNALQEMRNASKTGGALGSVSDKEHALLQSQIASLSKAQSVEQAKENLAKVIKYTQDAKDRLQAAYNMKHKEGGASGAPRVVDW